MAHFDPPAIQENDNGWGPSAVPEKFKDMPYQPFAKGDRLGKVRLQNIPPLGTIWIRIKHMTRKEGYFFRVLFNHRPN